MNSVVRIGRPAVLSSNHISHRCRIQRRRITATGDSTPLFIASLADGYVEKYTEPGILPYADSMGIPSAARIDQAHRGV